MRAGQARDRLANVFLLLFFKKEGLIPCVYRTRITPLPANLAERWQALEARATPSFFQSWTFVGCQVEQRFRGARLLAATQDGHDVALALLGGARGPAWLNETGAPVQDSVFIEYNGVLCATGEAAAAGQALRAAVRACGRVVLSGIGADTLAAARAAGWLVVRQTRQAPFVALGALAGPYLDSLSANTRAQIRRSMRLYGPELRLTPADTLAAALGFFEEMVGLHQESWVRRGKPGAFAHESIRAFHRALIARAWPRGEVALLRIDAGARHIGTLYFFVRDGHVLSYQSGFGASLDAREKPGLVCHALAIAYFADAGARVYDLLAGDDRYKRSLAGESAALYWATLYRAWSVAGISRKARALF